MKLSEIKAILNADTISKRNGIITARWGFFYRHGRDAYYYMNKVKELIKNAEIIDFGEHWAPFRSGESVANQSHWWVKFKIKER